MAKKKKNKTHNNKNNKNNKHKQKANKKRSKNNKDNKKKNNRNKKIERLFEKLDFATDNKNSEEINSIIKTLLAEINNVNIFYKSKIYYSVATAMNDLEYLDKTQKSEKNTESQIYYFRKSIENIELINNLNNDVLNLKFSLFINYANVLENIGRSVLAIEYYNKVLEMHSQSVIALGNIGMTYYRYSILNYNHLNGDYLSNYACLFLEQSVSVNDNAYNDKKIYFQNFINNLDDDYKKTFFGKKINIKNKKYTNLEEKEYRNWALENKLFLNVLNDLPSKFLSLSIANDDLTINSLLGNDDKFIYTVHGFFNQIKQEYIYARFLYYESIQFQNEVHYADKETNLVNTFDLSRYSIRLEKMKTVYRILYSLLDKVAYFINYYFNLGMKEKSVTFKSIWNLLDPDENIALSSIYWIHKDFHNKFCDSEFPYSKKINETRNHLEHKYLKITYGCYDIPNKWKDDLAEYISEEEFLTETMEMLKLLREIIINLSLAVNIEEFKKVDKSNYKILVNSGIVQEFKDEWKV